MKTDDNDRQQSKFFQALRRQETAQAPAFSSLVTARTLPPARASSWLQWAALSTAAAVLIAVGTGLWVASTRRGQAVTSLPQLTALSEWTAPTDVLLAVPTPLWGSQVTSVTDALGGSSADASFTSTATTTQEDP